MKPYTIGAAVRKSNQSAIYYRVGVTKQTLNRLTRGTSE
jgi:hypothetical protein